MKQKKRRDSKRFDDDVVLEKSKDRHKKLTQERDQARRSKRNRNTPE